MFRTKKIHISPESVICSICLDTEDIAMPSIKTKCGHSFHRKCLCTAINNSIKCPCCRADLISNETIIHLTRTQNNIAVLFNDDKTAFNRFTLDDISNWVDDTKRNTEIYMSEKISYLVEHHLLFAFLLLPVGYTYLAVYASSNIIVYLGIKPLLWTYKTIYRGIRDIYRNTISEQSVTIQTLDV